MHVASFGVKAKALGSAQRIQLVPHGTLSQMGGYSEGPGVVAMVSSIVFRPL